MGGNIKLTVFEIVAIRRLIGCLRQDVYMPYLKEQYPDKNVEKIPEHLNSAFTKLKEFMEEEL